ncbi:MAG: ABC transporter ATP-binding protein/permease [Thermodesulfobacteriota bacterium]
MSKQRETDPPVVKRSLFYWVLQGNLLLQLLLLLVIVAIVFLRVLPLEIQKRIVNDVLSGRDFSLLVTYCLIYLAAVFISSGLKFAINALQAKIGQQALTEMRRELYRHILRLPLSFFRKTQPGSVVASLVNELATSGNFVGMAVAVPVTNILTLIAFAVYLIWLHPLLGVVTLSIYPIVVLIVPMAQKGANRANKKRVSVARAMSDQITESISGVHELHAHGSFYSEEKKYNRLIDELLRIRIVWTLYRYGVKVLNNLIVSLGPVLVFILGGYLLIQGELELGSIVAFLSAQEKLYDPWKELIEFYQVYQDASIRYSKVMSTFDEKTQFQLDSGGKPFCAVEGGVEIKELEFSTDSGIKLLEQVNLSLEAGEHLALVGFSGSGKSTLAKCVGQLIPYGSGQILVDGEAVDLLSKEEIVRNIGFISQSPVIFSGTINDNLLYAHRAISEYSSAADDEPSLDDRIAVIQQTGLYLDILRFGLNTTLDQDKDKDLMEVFLRVRKNFQENFGDELAAHVEFYRKDRYLYHEDVAENILFGTAMEEDYLPDRISSNRIFVRFLKDVGLYKELVSVGTRILSNTVDILGDVPREDIFFSATPVEAADYDEILKLSRALQPHSGEGITFEGERKLLELALRFVPARHKVIELKPVLEKLILYARSEFNSRHQELEKEVVSFYDDAEYISARSILNNIFFGSLLSDSPKVEERVNQCIVHLLIEEDLLERVAAIGMEFDVGHGGDKLSGGQRQKLSIARVLIKHPKILIMDEATSALDNKSQARIQKLVEKWRGECTVISVIHRLDMLPSFDKVAVLKAGKVVEFGKPDELLKNKGVLYELSTGKSH